jgi:hypothetical protein
VLIPTPGRAKQTTQVVVSELTRRFGSPTVSNLDKVLAMTNPSFETVAYWIEAPHRSVFLRICDPGLFAAPLPCSEARVIVDVEYKDISRAK